jgi:pyridoxamine 5'-phosphate oxidase
VRLVTSVRFPPGVRIPAASGGRNDALSRCTRLISRASGVDNGRVMPLPWVDLLRDSLDAEFADRPRPATLATIGKDGAPRARTVICREIDAEGFQFFCSDARSDKNFEIRLRIEVEVVYWLPLQRRQYRLRGDAMIAGAAKSPPVDVARLWASLSDATRAMFFWPAPGEPLDPAATFPKAIDAGSAPPANFEVIIFGPATVEMLDLNPHPHDRRRWRRANEWREEPLNP